MKEQDPAKRDGSLKKFRSLLATQYRDSFVDDPDYAYLAVEAVCKQLGIKHMYKKSIRQYLGHIS